MTVRWRGDDEAAYLLCAESVVGDRGAALHAQHTLAQDAHCHTLLALKRRFGVVQRADRHIIYAEQQVATL